MSIKTIIGILICILIGIAVVMLLGYLNIEPFIAPYAAFTGWLTSGNVIETLQNPTTITATVASASAVALPLISKIQSYKTQATEIASSAKTQIDTVIREKDEALATVNSYKAQAEAATKQLADLKAAPPETDTDLLAQYETQITNLQGQVQAAQDQSTNFVKGLMQAANGALVTAPDGKIYSVLKLPPEIQIK